MALDGVARDLPAGGLPQRIVILHLDSLACLPALSRLFAVLGDRIGFVVRSDRFAAGHGGLWRQGIGLLRRSGWRFTLALGFDLIAPRVAEVLLKPLRIMFKGTALLTVRQHAVAAGARAMTVADINASGVVETVRAWRPDLVISLHFDQILEERFITGVGAPILNLHPALLPRHRGPCPSFWTLSGHDREAGISIHRIVDRSIDTGEVLAQAALPVAGTASMKELDHALYLKGVDLLMQLLQRRSPIVSAAACTTDDGERHPSPGAYESFPSASEVAVGRARGVRLWHFGHAARLLLAMAWQPKAVPSCREPL